MKIYDTSFFIDFSYYDEFMNPIKAKFKKIINMHETQKHYNILKDICEHEGLTGLPIFSINNGFNTFFVVKEKTVKSNKFKIKSIELIEADSIHDSATGFDSIVYPQIYFDGNSIKKSIFKKKTIEITAEKSQLLKKKNAVIDDVNDINKVSSNRTGLYKLIYSQNGVETIALFYCFLNQLNEQINLYAGDISLYAEVKFQYDKEVSRQGKPKLGIFTGSVDQGGVMHYYKFKDNVSKKITYHKVKKDIKADLDYFFANIDRSIKNNEKGTRKVLIAGVQGTGKSSFLNEIMLEYYHSHSILICTDLNQLIKHTQLCSKYKIPCISILEDCENFLDDRDSNLLNYLSGPLEPANVKGSFTFMTTNYPAKISDRIKNRPERIDEVYILSFLDGEDANEVVKCYFGKFLPENFDYTTLDGLFTGKTGAEIMKYADDVKKAADYKWHSFDKVTRKYIERVIATQKGKYKKLAEINPTKTDLAKTANGFGESIGFSGRTDIDVDEDDI